MPPKIYLHQHAGFEDAIRVVADQKKIDPYLAEKDYWLMHCLYGLKKLNYDFQLKGGTSLSKGYGIIHRFSEDIDIHITPPEDMKLRTGKNHDKDKDCQARKGYYDHLAQQIKIPGIVKVVRDEDFDTAPRYFSGGIRLHYEAKFPAVEDAKEGVLLEVGFDAVIPNKPVDISSWVFDLAMEKKTDVIDNRAMAIPCYDPAYTLVEKLQAITTKHRNYAAKGGAFPANFMRHYYDIYCLLQDKGVQAFIGTDNYHKHTKDRFPAIDLTAPLNENEAFLLKDEKRRALYKKEYERRPALYYQGQPPFEEVLKVIQENLDRL